MVIFIGAAKPLSAPTRLNIHESIITFAIAGILIFTRICNSVAPSILAASNMSGDTETNAE